MNVEWTEEAYDRLADVLVSSSLAEQDELERRVLDINARLSIESMALGESRSTARRRVWFVHPLVVQYDALTEPPRVVVFHVSRLRPRASDSSDD